MPTVLNDTASDDAFVGVTLEDAVSYAAGTHGVAADLSTGLAHKLLRLMPFGDSLTYGWEGMVTESGGYRPFLYDYLTSNDAAMDFVGTLKSGPDNFPDRDHEGHPGWILNEMIYNADEFMAAGKPDVILLM